MVLQRTTLKDYQDLALALKSLKQKNNEVYMILKRVCGNSYSSRLLKHQTDIDDIAYTLDIGMEKDYPEEKRGFF